MTAMEMVRKFGIEDGGMKDGARAMKITQNAKAAVKIADQIRGAKEEILAIIDDRTAAQRAAKAALEQKLEGRKTALKNGAPFELHYHDGEYLSGYEAVGPDADMLLSLGLAKNVRGWGAYIEPSTIAALSTSFTLADAEAYRAPAQADAEAQKAAQVEAVRLKAATTHASVKLASWTEPCDGSACECSLDQVIHWMDPDGVTRIERVHTY